MYFVVCTCVYVQKTEVDVHHLSTFIQWQELQLQLELTEWLEWLASKPPPVSTSPTLKLQLCTLCLTFYMDTGDLGQMLMPTEPSPQLQYFHVFVVTLLEFMTWYSRQNERHSQANSALETSVFAFISRRITVVFIYIYFLGSKFSFIVRYGIKCWDDNVNCVWPESLHIVLNVGKQNHLKLHTDCAKY